MYNLANTQRRGGQIEAMRLETRHHDEKLSETRVELCMCEGELEMGKVVLINTG